MVNLCMVGTGGIAAQHMKAFRQIGGTASGWVISRKPDKAREFAEDWGFEHFGADLNVALADPKVDLVVITSPSELHADQAIRSLQAGKDVIIEIPVATSLADAERVASEASKARRRALVCHTMRSFPAIREVRRRIATGKLHLSQIAGYFAIPRRRNQGMAGLQRNWIDSLLWHHGCHMVDVALWALGTDHVDHVNAILGRSHATFGMAMDLVVQFRTAAEQLVTHSLTYNTEAFCWELRFMGDEETLTYHNGQLLNEKNVQVIPESYWVDLVQQNLEMLTSISEGSPSEFDVESVLPAMKVLDQAQSSALGHPDVSTGTTRAEIISPMRAGS
jgi:2-hydroxy-4-carboxymuconate semialdehyde hemiacetal dehydrogenase